MEKLKYLGEDESAEDDGTGNETIPEPGDEEIGFMHYKDEGCAVHPSCLNCPEPKGCLYENGRVYTKKRTRDKEIVRLFLEEKKSEKELTEMFKVSERTIQRVLQKEREKKT